MEEGQAIIFFKSSHWLKEPSKGRLMGLNNAASANVEGAGAAALGLSTLFLWVEAGQSGKSLAKGKQEGGNAH